MSNFTDEQLKKEFDKIDKDRDNAITIEELKTYYLPMQEMMGISRQLAEMEIQGMVKRLDVDHNDRITFEGKRASLRLAQFYFSPLLEFKQFIGKK